MRVLLHLMTDRVKDYSRDALENDVNLSENDLMGFWVTILLKHKLSHYLASVALYPYQKPI